MLRHRYGSPTAFAVSCLGKEKNKIVKIFGLSLSMSILIIIVLFFRKISPFVNVCWLLANNYLLGFWCF